MATVKSVDEDSADFLQIDAGSEAAGAGTDVGLTEDYAGQPMSSPPDIGAFAVGGGNPLLLNMMQASSPGRAAL